MKKRVFLKYAIWLVILAALFSIFWLPDSLIYKEIPKVKPNNDNITIFFKIVFYTVWAVLWFCTSRTLLQFCEWLTEPED